jgi:AcrR family transcriptional regulator
LSSRGDQPALGLRERKKARTRAAIQRHALRLFRERGYDATTVSQIAEAADVSESTFFRYFATKEAVALWDDFDPLFVAAFLSQPADVRPIPAIRASFRAVLGQLPMEGQAELRQRVGLILSVPELRAASFEQFGPTLGVLGDAVAERAGRRPDDLAVRAVVGAVIGVWMAAVYAAVDDPAADILTLMDEAMAQLEAGLPL